MNDTPTVNKDFHMKEYESLKREIINLVRDSRKLEVYAIGALGGFYAWFLSKKDGVSRPELILLIPLLVALLGSWRAWAIFVRLRDIAEYLIEVEKEFALADNGLPGWETHLKTVAGSPFLTSAIGFWCTLVVVAVVGLCVLGH